MMRKTTSLATVALCSGVSFGVMPAEQLDIHISALMDPPSCSVSLSVATIELGTIVASRLDQNAPTRLGDQLIQVVITCPESAGPGIIVRDLSAGTAMSIAGNPGLSWSQQDLMGLGTYNGTAIGAWAISIDSANVLADGKSVPVLVAENSDTPVWQPAKSNWQVMTPNNSTVYAFGHNLPETITQLTVPLKVSVALNAMSELNVTSRLSFSGTAELTLKYY
ncbi:hypothetical protein K6664_10415 [Escherichia ruysiae]|uniref:hypothetical protein n=1 Tax=Escherichia TaxID=561 RepID=UPI000CF7746F|nr:MULTISPECIES: hypothetical protein [Escherichia]MBS5154499.1 hypothetical protein [Escherichia coli]MBY7187214.1 hypothetical protein [Escherichia ruysiae]MBY7307812.1 hypothetical protein [Escherichia ruysiae]MBY7367019.1 hypothetical protein [Escherichia coli]